MSEQKLNYYNIDFSLYTNRGLAGSLGPGSWVFDGSIEDFNWFDFSWVLELTQPGLFSVHGSTQSDRRFSLGLKTLLKCEIKVCGRGIIRQEQLLKEVEAEDDLMRGNFESLLLFFPSFMYA